MGQPDLKNILTKFLLGCIWAILFAFFIRLIQKAEVKRNRPFAAEKKLDFLANRQLFCTKFHLIQRIVSVLFIVFGISELIFLVRKEDVLDLKPIPDYLMCALTLLFLVFAILFSFLDNQIAIKKRGIWCKFGFSEKIVKRKDIDSVLLDDDTLIIQLKNDLEIVLKGLKDPENAKNSLQNLIDINKDCDEQSETL